MVLENLNVRLPCDGGEQCPFNLAAGHVLRVQDAALRVAAFLAQVELPSAVFARSVALRELHPKIDQLGDAVRAFLDDGADDALVAKARAGFEGVADVHLEGVLLAGDGGDSALGVVGVRLGAVLLGDDGDAPVARDLEREGKSGDAAAEHEIIKVFH